MPDQFDVLDEIGTPTCPLHLMPMEVVGEAPDGRDARWVCPTQGCSFVRIS